MAFPSAFESSRMDANQVPSVTVVQGSAGTATPMGTLTMPVTGDPATGAMYVYNLGPAGALALNSGTITTIQNGTQQTLGTVGVVNNLVTGTIAAVTSVTNLAAGTVSAVNSIVAGTQNTLGTVGVVNNLVTGTINALAAGTITTGTISMTAGTLSPIPTISQSVYGTLGTTGALVFGTIAGGTSSGAGTEIFVTGLSIVVPAAAGSQDMSVGFGTNAGALHAGTGVLARGQFVVGGGISRSFVPAVNSGTNAQVTYCLGGAGTAFFELSYFTAPSTL
jgi:hypothetical protein